MHATIRRYEGVDATRINEVVGKVNETLVPKLQRASGLRRLLPDRGQRRRHQLARSLRDLRAGRRSPRRSSRSGSPTRTSTRRFPTRRRSRAARSSRRPTASSPSRRPERAVVPPGRARHRRALPRSRQSPCRNGPETLNESRSRGTWAVSTGTVLRCCFNALLSERRARERDRDESPSRVFDANYRPARPTPTEGEFSWPKD